MHTQDKARGTITAAAVHGACWRCTTRNAGEGSRRSCNACCIGLATEAHDRNRSQSCTAIDHTSRQAQRTAQQMRVAPSHSAGLHEPDRADLMRHALRWPSPELGSVYGSDSRIASDGATPAPFFFSLVGTGRRDA